MVHIYAGIPTVTFIRWFIYVLFKKIWFCLFSFCLCFSFVLVLLFFSFLLFCFFKMQDIYEIRYKENVAIYIHKCWMICGFGVQVDHEFSSDQTHAWITNPMSFNILFITYLSSLNTVKQFHNTSNLWNNQHNFWINAWNEPFLNWKIC